MDVAGSLRDVPNPPSESTVLIDGLNPFGEEHALSPVAVSVLTLGLQHQDVARRQTDEEVGTVFSHHTTMDVEHLEAEMVVLHPGGHLGGVVEHEGI